MNRTHKKISAMTKCALFAALICILAPHSIAIGPVPITLAVFAVEFTAVVLGWKMGTIATAVYLLTGCAGLPVFSGYKAGIGVLLGVTGGYATAYIFMALITGFAADIRCEKGWMRALSLALGLILSMLACYALGTAQFVFITGSSVKNALAVCVIPFIAFDCIKLFAAGVLGSAVKRAVSAAEKRRG